MASGQNMLKTLTFGRRRALPPLPPASECASMDTASLVTSLGAGGVGGGEGGSDWNGAWSVLRVIAVVILSSSTSSSLAKPPECRDIGPLCRDRGLGTGRSLGMLGRPTAMRRYSSLRALTDTIRIDSDVCRMSEMFRRPVNLGSQEARRRCDTRLLRLNNWLQSVCRHIATISRHQYDLANCRITKVRCKQQRKEESLPSPMENSAPNIANAMSYVSLIWLPAASKDVLKAQVMTSRRKPDSESRQ